MPVLKKLLATRLVLAAAAYLGAFYLRLVWWTNCLTIEPATEYKALEPPFIMTFWHGQHFLTPFFAKKGWPRGKALISRHRDGEINARVVELLGIDSVRGSGAHDNDFHRKGGALAFKPMLKVLIEKRPLALTADVPKVSRVAGLGVVKLAQFSAQPICPVAIATSRRIELNNWDRSAVHLPFGRSAIVLGNPIYVPRKAGDAELEAIRRQVENELDRITARAYEIVDRKASAPP